MNIKDYYQLNGSKLSFTRSQASDFAKKEAHDFNPIHDADSKRFCVPGDLLFSVIIYHYGLHQNMKFTFSGMVGDNVKLILPDCDEQHDMLILDENDRQYLTVECSGDTSHNRKLIDSLATDYVEFSSQAFPTILVPLMSEQDVMINPERPLIVYESMSFELDRLDIDDIELKLSSKTLEVEGKRGNVALEYELFSDGSQVGHGCKRMVLSGLRPFEKDKMDRLVAGFLQRKQEFEHLHA
jgi:hypothetical protein